jgi:ribosome maturation factor RimP
MSRDREERINRLVTDVLSESEFELVDLEFAGSARRSILRVYIDKDGGVTHGDCVRVSRILGDHLDADPVVGLGSYVLEVSSPGIDRPLKKAADFDRFRGETAAVTTRTRIQGRSNHLGVILGMEGDTLVLEQPDLGRTEIPLTDVQKASLRRDPWLNSRSGDQRNR